MLSNKFILCCVIALCFISCAKESELADFTIPDQETSQPVFFISGNVGDELLDFVAGDHGFYMFTSFSVNDTASQFIGELAHESGCSEDCRSLQITLHNVSLAGINPQTLESTDGGITLPFRKEISNLEPVVAYTFYIADSTMHDASHVWEFKTLDGATIDTISGGIVNLELDTPIDFKAKLTSTTADGCISSQEQQIYADANSINLNSCDCNLEFSANTPGSVTLSTNCTEDFFWSNGSMEQEQVLDTVFENFCLQSGTPNQVFCSTCVQSYFAQSLQFCITGFLYEKMESSTSGREPYASLVYHNAANVPFYSDFDAQPESAFLQVLAAEDYQRNENQEATKILTVKLTGNLQSENGDVLETELQGNFGIAHPD